VRLRRLQGRVLIISREVCWMVNVSLNRSIITIAGLLEQGGEGGGWRGGVTMVGSCCRSGVYTIMYDIFVIDWIITRLLWVSDSVQYFSPILTWVLYLDYIWKHSEHFWANSLKMFTHKCSKFCFKFWLSMAYMLDKI